MCHAWYLHGVIFAVPEVALILLFSTPLSRLAHVETYSYSPSIQRGIRVPFVYCIDKHKLIVHLFILLFVRPFVTYSSFLIVKKISEEHPPKLKIEKSIVDKKKKKKKWASYHKTFINRGKHLLVVPPLGDDFKIKLQLHILITF